MMKWEIFNRGNACGSCMTGQWQVYRRPVDNSIINLRLRIFPRYVHAKCPYCARTAPRRTSRGKTRCTICSWSSAPNGTTMTRHTSPNVESNSMLHVCHDPISRQLKYSQPARLVCDRQRRMAVTTMPGVKAVILIGDLAQKTRAWECVGCVYLMVSPILQLRLRGNPPAIYSHRTRCTAIFHLLANQVLPENVMAITRN